MVVPIEVSCMLNGHTKCSAVVGIEFWASAITEPQAK